jgi:signal transduction histidine kinase
MSDLHTLSQGNRLQRAYYRWAQPRYARIALEDPGLAREIEEFDHYLYSRRGLLAWLGWCLGLAGLVAGLRATGATWQEAVPIGVLLWVCLTLALASAWFLPRRALSPSALLLNLVLGLLVGAGVALLIRYWSNPELLNSMRLRDAASNVTVPALLLMAGTVLLMVALSWAGRKAREQRLQRLQLVAERDAARAAAAETELRLLQAQIHPHFVFNTLATLQHWVNRADPRAGPLLAELTGFLRRSTEMLGRVRVPLEEEVRAAAHYLAIMQTRMGERLRFEIDVDPECAAQTIPPGLLLTLVENAIEHGLEPRIEGGVLRLSSGRGDADAGSWWLRVEDDGLGLSPHARDQVGLSNLRQRLEQHYGTKAWFTLRPLSTGGTRAELAFEESSCPAS